MPFKLLVRATIVAAALFAATVHVSPAGAATPCWKTLLNDWYDGRIDGTYPVHCYSDALHHLPSDVQTYSSAHDDILRALQSAKAALQKSGTKVTANTEVPAPGGKGKGTKTGTTNTTTTGGPIGRQHDKGLGGVADKLNPSSASSLPVPLLVLGGLALLLVAAGAAGLVAKRLQTRRQPPAT